MANLANANPDPPLKYLGEDLSRDLSRPQGQRIIDTIGEMISGCGKYRAELTQTNQGQQAITGFDYEFIDIGLKTPMINLPARRATSSAQQIAENEFNHRWTPNAIIKVPKHCQPTPDAILAAIQQSRRNSSITQAAVQISLAQAIAWVRRSTGERQRTQPGFSRTLLVRLGNSSSLEGGRDGTTQTGMRVDARVVGSIFSDWVLLEESFQ